MVGLFRTQMPDQIMMRPDRSVIGRFVSRVISSRRTIAVGIATCAVLYAPCGVVSGQTTDSKISPDASDGNQPSPEAAQANVVVSLSRKKINFGKVPAGTKSSPQTVMFTNNSNAELAAPVVNVTGTGFNLGTNGCRRETHKRRHYFNSTRPVRPTKASFPLGRTGRSWGLCV